MSVCRHTRINHLTDVELPCVRYSPRKFGLERRTQSRGLLDESPQLLRKRISIGKSRAVLRAQLERSTLGGLELPFERAPLLELVL
jgi:hypothetical protein